jgi:hypothetical protein
LSFKVLMAELLVGPGITRGGRPDGPAGGPRSRAAAAARGAALATGIALLLGAVLAPSARAESFGVTEKNFEAGTCTVDTCTYKSVEEHPEQAYTQAGGHPAFGITGFELNSEPVGLLGARKPIGAVKNVRVDVPPGLAANPEAVGERCPVKTFEEGLCPADHPRSHVGENQLTVLLPGELTNSTITAQVYNLEPAQGLPLEFGIEVPGISRSLLLGHVSWHREPEIEAHGVATGDFHEYFELIGIPNSIPVLKSKLIFFGNTEGPGFLTLPSECSTTATAHLRVESYEGQVSETFTHTPVGVTGCSNMPFGPLASVTPGAPEEGGTAQSDAPDAAAVHVTLPQNRFATKIDTADPREITVRLPEGMTLNPAGAQGLATCSDAQFGIAPTRPGERPAVLPAEGGGAAPVSCPPASQIGTFAIETPDLPPGSLTGSVYVGAPLGPNLEPGDAGPESGLQYRIFLDASSPRYGVDVRLVGNVVANALTGRLATTVATPQLPFSETVVHLKGGPRAPLANPLACGEAQSEGSFIPYGEALGGGATVPAAAGSKSAFPVTGCSAPLPFGVSQSMAASPAQAGSATTFTLALGRADGEQYVEGLKTTLPEGVLGSIASVPTLCGEAQANAGSCPAASQIGTVQTAAGSGSEPLSVPAPGEPPGAVYLTGPYAGGPYGLSIVLPAEHVGPYDLGRVISRAKIEIDPYTTRVSTTAVRAYLVSPSGAVSESRTPVPTVLGGAAVRLRSLTITLGRPGFMLNPTSCAPLVGETALDGISSPGGTTATPYLATSPFAVSGCSSLPFSPRFSPSTSARTSRLGGASLQVSITRQAHEANIREVAVTLPPQIVSRNSTLHNACPEATARANILACPALSRVGEARLTTPLLPGTLSGPAILVSHGGAAFPDLDFVLQGDGVTLIEVSNTDIKNGVTSSTFASLPDAPFTSFQATFPTGPDSLLSANGSFCSRPALRALRVRAGSRRRRRSARARHAHVAAHRAHRRARRRRPGHAVRTGPPVKLVMPTTLVAYNGAKITQSTPIAVTDCGRSGVNVAKIVVPRVRIRGGRAFLTVIVPGGGTLSGRGTGLRPGRRRAHRSGRVTLVLALSRAGHNAISRHGRLISHVRLSFAPGGGRRRLFARLTLRFR